VLILPGTLFSGSPMGAFATASICHFECAQPVPAKLEGPGFLLPDGVEALHVQNLLRLAMYLAQPGRAAELDRRRRLLAAIIDAFTAERQAQPITDDDRLAMAWSAAGRNLHRMRTLKDVADLLGVSESAFRALHRRSLGTTAGEHLRQLRLTRAEELLATTGQSLEMIAGQVGYSHAATLSNAFRQRHGKTPGQFRHWSNPFA
jgi:AraC-like DNA-binding protein